MNAPLMTANDLLLDRIRGEYQEMPGLCLSAAQASRLWGLDGTTCLAVLEQLLAERFLHQTPSGNYVAFPASHRPPAKAALPHLDRTVRVRSRA